MRRSVNPLSSLLKWGFALAAAAALVVGGYLYLRLDEEIRQYAEQLLADHYEHLDVRVGSARLVRGQGIAIYNLQIAEREADSSTRPMLLIDEAFLVCAAEWEELIRTQPAIEQIVIKRPRIHARRLAAGGWNVQSLSPPPCFSDLTPRILVENALVSLSDEAKQSASPLVLRGIDVTVQPADEQVAASAGGSAADADRSAWQLQGAVSGAPARRIEFEGSYHPCNHSADVRVTVDDLQLSPELLAVVPGIDVGDLSNVEFHGQASATARLSRSADANAPWNVAAKFQIARGGLRHPLLPHPITDLAAEGECDGATCHVRLATGKCGTAEITLAVRRQGWGARAPVALNARIGGLPLDRQFRAALPEAAARMWARFQPSGQVDADLQTTFDGQHWSPHLTVSCREVGLTDAENFPYRLERTSGQIVYTTDPEQGGQLQVDLTGLGQGQPVKLRAQLAGLATPTSIATGAPPNVPSYVGWIEISGRDMPIHDRLVSALPDEGQRVMRSLRPKGRFHFDWRGERRDQRQLKLDTQLGLQLVDGAIQFEKFPYAIRHIEGKFTAHNGEWQFHDLTSRDPNGATVITCQGDCTPTPAGRRLQLTFTGADVPLDTDLRQALRPDLQQMWRQLRPQGRVNLTARLTHEFIPDQQKVPDIRVTLEPFEQSVSVEPEFFRYRLDQLMGRIHYVNGHVTLENMRARHGRLHVATQGSWEPTEEGGWRLQLSDLHVDHLTFSRDLISSLPGGLQKLLDMLRPNGTFSLHDSQVWFVKPPRETSRLATGWNVHLDCHQSDLSCGVQLDNLAGGVHLVGEHDGQSFACAGELVLDSVVWNNIQLTRVRGPLWVDPAVCLLGQAASLRQQQPPRDLTAEVYDGTLVGNAQIRYDGHPRYDLQAAVAGASVARFANERLGGRRDLTGTITGQIALSGVGKSADSLKGQGEVHVLDANIYELPVLVALLKVLQNRTPNKTAFNRCDANFVVQGRHMHFRQLNFLGDAVSLYGRGESNFDGQHLNLVFYSLVGRNQIAVPVLQSLVGQASEQILQLRVDGSLQDPQIHREALPAVSQVLQQIQAELGVTEGPATQESRFPFWPLRR